MRKALSDHNLPTKGKREDLIWRHKEFVMRFNANLDSMNPVDVNTIIEELELVEKDVRKSKIELDSSQTALSKFFKSTNSNSSLESTNQKRKQDPIKDAIRAYRSSKRKKIEEIKEMLKNTVPFTTENDFKAESEEKLNEQETEFNFKSAQVKEHAHDSQLSSSSTQQRSQNSQCASTPHDLSIYQCSPSCAWTTAWNAKYSRPFHFNRVLNLGTFNEPDHTKCHGHS